MQIRCLINPNERKMEKQNSRIDALLAGFMLACSVITFLLCTVVVIVQIWNLGLDLIPVLPLVFVWYLNYEILKMAFTEYTKSRPSNDKK